MKMVLVFLIAFSFLYADFNRDDSIGIVIDNTTGLQWQDDTSGIVMMRSTALSYCEELELGSFKDWRLPNINELKSIADKDAQPSVDSIFQYILPKKYWSSTSFPNHIANVRSWLGWTIDFSDGTNQSHEDIEDEYRVRCVRAGDLTPLPNTPPLWENRYYRSYYRFYKNSDDSETIADLKEISYDEDGDVLTYSIESLVLSYEDDRAAWEKSLYIEDGILKVHNLVTNDPERTSSKFSLIIKVDDGFSSNTTEIEFNR